MSLPTRGQSIYVGSTFTPVFRVSSGCFSLKISLYSILLIFNFGTVLFFLHLLDFLFSPSHPPISCLTVPDFLRYGTVPLSIYQALLTFPFDFNQAPPKNTKTSSANVSKIKICAFLYIYSCTSLHYFQDFRLISDCHHNQIADVGSQRDHRFQHGSVSNPICWILTGVLLERCRGQRSPQKLGFGVKIVISGAVLSLPVSWHPRTINEALLLRMCPVQSCQSTINMIKAGSIY